MQIEPERAALLSAAEEAILSALEDALARGRMDYMHFGPAYDVTMARIAALSWHLPSDSDGNPQGGDGTAPSQSDDSAGRNGIAQGRSA